MTTRVGLFCLALLTACGSPPAPEPVAPIQKPAPELHDGPLEDYVVAAGLRWMVVGRPRDVAEVPWLRESIHRLIPNERLDLYEEASGVDLRTTPSAVIARYDYSTLYLAETPGDAAPIIEKFEARLVTEPERKEPHPRIVETLGVVGETPQILVTVDRDLAAFAVGDPLAARVVGLFAQKKLEKSPPALAGAALSTLPELPEAPVRAYAPGPFEGEAARAGRGLLGAATAVGLTIRPAGQGVLAATLHIAGDWDASAAAALLGAWEDLALSSTGKLLGLDQPAAAPVIGSSEKTLKLRVELRVDPLVAGLRAAVMADVWEILGLPRGQSPDLTPRETPVAPPEQ